MAPAFVEGFLAKRQNNLDNNNNVEYCDIYGCYSNWDTWGRWVALGVIVVCILLLAFLCSCYNSRRRRRRGMAPMYGTGWMASGPPGGQQYGHTAPPGVYYSHEPYNGGAAPPYSPPLPKQTTGNTFNSNEGYYGQHGYGQTGGIELQEPSSSYQPQRGGDPVYEAPLGPPPRKGDGIIR